MLSFAETAQQSQRLLLDECVTRRLVVKLPKDMQVDIAHTVDVRGLGWAASDTAIIQHLQNCHYDYFVTADRALIRQCLQLGIKVAKYHNGQACFLDSNQFVTLGEHKQYNKGHVRLGKSYKHEFKRTIIRLRRRIKKRAKIIALWAQKLQNGLIQRPAIALR